MVKSTCRQLLVFVLLPCVLFQAIPRSTAQAPSSLSARGFGVEVRGGAYPLADHGYYIFIPADVGNSYQIIGIYDVAGSKGTFSYSPLSASSGRATALDSISGTLSATFSFNGPSSGSVEVGPNPSSIYQCSQTGPEV